MKRQIPFTQRIRDGMVSALEVPGDLARGDTLITVTGTSLVAVENYRRLLKCSECEMVILGKVGILTIRGRRLCIDRLEQEELTISGQITGISMESR